MTRDREQEIVSRWLDHGYEALTETERMIVAFLATPGGCHACNAVRPARWRVTES